MTTIELSNEFDVLVDSYRRFKAYDTKEELDSLEFNEYEKSIFLTEAQEQLIVDLYSGRNDRQASFEGTEELRQSLRNLIKESTLTEHPNVTSYYRSQLFELPEDLWFITYEEAIINDDNAGCHNSTILNVTPITHDELYNALNNPFRRQNKRRALRVDVGLSMIEVISDYIIGDYNIKYITKPTPIVLGNFSEVTVDGVNKITECKLDSLLHRPILERAV